MFLNQIKHSQVNAKLFSSQCFWKIRVGKRIENTEIQELLDEKLKNQKIINSSPSKEVLSAAQCEVQKIEENISKVCAERNCEIVSN